MPRKCRFQITGVPQHVIQRGNNREPCFYAEADCRRYLADLGGALKDNQCELHAYVLMTNHVHLLITPQIPHGLSRAMQDTGRKYVRYINTTYHRTGTLWEGRYKAALVDSEAYLFTCMRYIEMNPVRAGMVVHPGDYRWSSHAANACGQHSPIISPHPLYLQLAGDPADRQRTYRELFHRMLEAGQLHAIRSALNQELVLGREDFKDKIGRVLQRQVRRGKDGRPAVKEVAADYRVIPTLC
jgi:putative transposase